MESGVTIRELAQLAGVKETTVSRAAKELLELLERDLQNQSITKREPDD
jgi:DNA-binding LacI/PurR family transcriptional regulator